MAQRGRTSFFKELGRKLTKDTQKLGVELHFRRLTNLGAGQVGKSLSLQYAKKTKQGHTQPSVVVRNKHGDFKCSFNETVFFAATLVVEKDKYGDKPVEVYLNEVYRDEVRDLGVNCIIDLGAILNTATFEEPVTLIIPMVVANNNQQPAPSLTIDVSISKFLERPLLCRSTVFPHEGVDTFDNAELGERPVASTATNGRPRNSIDTSTTSVVDMLPECQRLKRGSISWYEEWRKRSHADPGSSKKDAANSADKTTKEDKMTELLEDPVKRVYFKRHLEEQYCAEMIYFWLEVERYRKSKAEERHERATTMLHKFLEEGAPRQVNLSCQSVQEVAKLIETSKDVLSEALFDNMQAEVKTLMLQNCLHSFLSSPANAELQMGERSYMELSDRARSLFLYAVEEADWTCVAERHHVSVFRKQTAASVFCCKAFIVLNFSLQEIVHEVRESQPTWNASLKDVSTVEELDANHSIGPWRFTTSAGDERFVGLNVRMLSENSALLVTHALECTAIDTDPFIRTQLFGFLVDSLPNQAESSLVSFFWLAEVPANLSKLATAGLLNHPADMLHALSKHLTKLFDEDDYAPAPTPAPAPARAAAAAAPTATAVPAAAPCVAAPTGLPAKTPAPGATKQPTAANQSGTSPATATATATTTTAAAATAADAAAACSAEAGAVEVRRARKKQYRNVFESYLVAVAQKEEEAPRRSTSVADDVVAEVSVKSLRQRFESVREEEPLPKPK